MPPRPALAIISPSNHQHTESTMTNSIKKKEANLALSPRTNLSSLNTSSHLRSSIKSTNSSSLTPGGNLVNQRLFTPVLAANNNSHSPQPMNFQKKGNPVICVTNAERTIRSTGKENAGPQLTPRQPQPQPVQTRDVGVQTKDPNQESQNSLQAPSELHSTTSSKTNAKDPRVLFELPFNPHLLIKSRQSYSADKNSSMRSSCVEEIFEYPLLRCSGGTVRLDQSTEEEVIAVVPKGVQRSKQEAESKDEKLGRADGKREAYCESAPITSRGRSVSPSILGYPKVQLRSPKATVEEVVVKAKRESTYEDQFKGNLLSNYSSEAVILETFNSRNNKHHDSKVRSIRISQDDPVSIKPIADFLMEEEGVVVIEESPQPLEADRMFPETPEESSIYISPDFRRESTTNQLPVRQPAGVDPIELDVRTNTLTCTSSLSELSDKGSILAIIPKPPSAAKIASAQKPSCVQNTIQSQSPTESLPKIEIARSSLPQVTVTSGAVSPPTVPYNTAASTRPPQPIPELKKQHRPKSQITPGAVLAVNYCIISPCHSNYSSQATLHSK